MNKHVSLIFSFIFTVLVMPVMAQNIQRNISAGVNIYGGVGGYDKDKSLIQTSEPYKYLHYWGTEIEGSYRLKLYRALQFRPALSIYYERHDGLKMAFNGPGGTQYGESHINEWGMHVVAPVGLSFKAPSGSLEIETGPVFGLYFKQRPTKGEGMVDKDDIFKRYKWHWRFGARYNFIGGRFYAKMAFDLAMSNYCHTPFGEKCRDRNVLSGGIGVNF